MLIPIIFIAYPEALAVYLKARASHPSAVLRLDFKKPVRYFSPGLALLFQLHLLNYTDYTSDLFR